MGFIGAGQLAHALVKGFTAAGKLQFCKLCLVLNPLANQSFIGLFIYLSIYLHDCPVPPVFLPRCDCCESDYSQLPGHGPAHCVGAEGEKMSFWFVA